MMTYQTKSVLITAPSDDFVTLDEVKNILGIASSDQDAMISASISAIVEQLDPSTGGWLGRALRPQTWELRLSQFPCDEIVLPFPPVTEISSVKYDDQAGIERTLTVGDDYRVFNLNDRVRTRIVRPYNGQWPVARCDLESVRVRYTCGYASSPSDLMPQAIKNAIALGVRGLLSQSERNLFVNREEIPGVISTGYVVSDAAGDVIRKAMSDLLSIYRVW
jgi:uncharacterized phiE125 gp8 family phage protein